MLWRKIKQVKGDGECQSLRRGFCYFSVLGEKNLTFELSCEGSIKASHTNIWGKITQDTRSRKC